MQAFTNRWNIEKGVTSSGSFARRPEVGVHRHLLHGPHAHTFLGMWPSWSNQNLLVHTQMQIVHSVLTIRLEI